MGHTPGPWYVGKYGDNDSDVCAEDGPVICALRSGKADPYDMTADADAALIAAAPELLAVAKMAFDYAQDTKGRFIDHWDGEDAESYDKLCEACDAAIAKAEGRE